MWVLHRVIRRLARISLWSFFADVLVLGEENVPLDGPLVIVSTHHNMMIDPAVLSCTVPHKRVLHYWAKSSLFANPVARWVMLSTGNIPVERGTGTAQDNQVLFRSTVDTLAAGQAIALFPEGTSYTEPRIMQVKTGASRSTLEFVRDHPGKPVTLVPATIVYTDKAKYRSSIIVQYGTPISLDEFKREFTSDEDGAPKQAVKKLTLEVERRLVEMSINAPDWEPLFIARTARDILWTKRAIELTDFVDVSQTVIDLFATPGIDDLLEQPKKKLLKYYSLLKSTKLTHADLADLPLPRELDPARGDVPLPSRLTTLSILIRDTLACAVRLPFFALPLAIHAPAYFVARLGGKLEVEEETQAQNKVVVGLFFLTIVYSTLFFMLWAALWLSPAGAILAFGLVYGLAQYHTRLIDDQYAHAKRVVAAWRVLVGVWMPRSWEPVLTQPYEEPVIPPINLYLDANRTTPHPAPQPRPQRPPRKRLVRHVLRARVECSKALEQLFAALKHEPRPLAASPHLAERYGNKERKTRNSYEVLEFLRNRGAVFEVAISEDSDDWGALSSDEPEPRSPID